MMFTYNYRKWHSRILKHLSFSLFFFNSKTNRFYYSFYFTLRVSPIRIKNDFIPSTDKSCWWRILLFFSSLSLYFCLLYSSLLYYLLMLMLALESILNRHLHGNLYIYIYSRFTHCPFNNTQSLWLLLLLFYAIECSWFEFYNCNLHLVCLLVLLLSEKFKMNAKKKTRGKKKKKHFALLFFALHFNNWKLNGWNY